MIASLNSPFEFENTGLTGIEACYDVLEPGGTFAVASNADTLIIRSTHSGKIIFEGTHAFSR